MNYHSSLDSCCCFATCVSLSRLFSLCHCVLLIIVQIVEVLKRHPQPLIWGVGSQLMTTHTYTTHLQKIIKLHTASTDFPLLRPLQGRQEHAPFVASISSRKWETRSGGSSLYCVVPPKPRWYRCFRNIFSYPQ